jgi:hypothetical protein
MPASLSCIYLARACGSMMPKEDILVLEGTAEDK